ncbi:hypothetical protein XMIN_3727 [Xanthomonas citri pv. mangiferaeindicae LMG 941]|nr:hypothetical protein XMIN_3727 [Xanthomonas citri pv. mangiferaeindicae LMG 941]
MSKMQRDMPCVHRRRVLDHGAGCGCPVLIASWPIASPASRSRGRHRLLKRSAYQR